ncbi:ATP-binding protein [Pseudenhygromyxa sp. WMMC2535]|uniref:protoglobin domain-containing protein n=1 Tax=Pseudenhygromyxa sp. WMMC2535 TaxID=2712867 RepID=UPI0015548776|nr:protoglobin domain-containing protein [Pseudenhygromyxa sp. WMMC2535]NVB37365.1 ATP-binding protein [Pseudenhygromyxa sp. WMMC2535]
MSNKAALDADLSGFFSEIADYVGFGPEDAASLRRFLPLAEPHFQRIAEHFYECIVAHPGAHEAITGGEAQIERLKQTLIEWMRSGLEGPHDDEFCQRRARIGHVHVRIGLPQRYMVTAINVMRLDFREVVHDLGDAYSVAEVRELNAAIDRLFDLELAIMLETYKIETDERLRRRERLATIGQLAASIGHDLRNPLSVMESSLYILRRRTQEDPRAAKHIEKIAHQIDECDAIITHLLEMARNQSPRRDNISARELLEAALEAAAVPGRIAVEVHGFDDLTLWVDTALLKQALINLLINAVQAQRNGSGEISLRLEHEDQKVKISVLDRGAGFDPDTLPLIFEPLVTTKATGTGLGLALVKSVAERHGGSVRAANRADGGAMVEIHLPEAVPPSQPH